MEIALQLDSALKAIIEDLFFLMTQTSPGFRENESLREDGVAIFRIVKEFALARPQSAEPAQPEICTVSSEDIARMLRFICWILSYGGQPVLAPQTERAQNLRTLFASVVLQAQAQYSGFECLLRAYGVDQQLDPRKSRGQMPSAAKKNGKQDPKSSGQFSGQSSGASSGPSENDIALSGLKAERKDLRHLTRLRMTARGAELIQVVQESTWTADGWKKSTT